jgi:hypothetical protein
MNINDDNKEYNVIPCEKYILTETDVKTGVKRIVDFKILIQEIVEECIKKTIDVGYKPLDKPHELDNE